MEREPSSLAMALCWQANLDGLGAFGLWWRGGRKRGITSSNSNGERSNKALKHPEHITDGVIDLGVYGRVPSMNPQLRDITTMNRPSLPLENRSPQSSSASSHWGNGQCSVSLHSSWAAVHHVTHSSSYVLTDSISGMAFLENPQQPIRNHWPTSAGRGSLGSFPGPCGNIHQRERGSKTS